MPNYNCVLQRFFMPRFEEVEGAHGLGLSVCDPAHMLQLLSNSITIFLFHALKQMESMLNVPKE